MTTITLPRATVEQALEALEKATYMLAFLSKQDPKYTDAWEELCLVGLTPLRAALAQQAEAVAAERERCAEYLMQQAAECRENSPTRVTLESCAAVLRLGLVEWVAQQAEPVEPQGQLAALQAMLRAEVDRLIAAGIQPQRKPLSEEEIDALPWNGSPRQFARAVERAHKIGEGA